jgi:hypothetical protein
VVSLHIGITGSRNGATHEQLIKARLILAGAWRAGNVMHHGRCVGADSQMHAIARSLGYVIEQHPPANRAMEDLNCDVQPGEIMHARLPYADRNRAIVDASSQLIVLPQYPEDDPRSKRSGTWMTARYASRQGTELHIVIPTEWPA